MSSPHDGVISNFCTHQRQQEQKNFRKLLIFGFASSALLHGVLAYALPRWSIESPTVEEPMELTIVDKPKPQPKPKIESQPVAEQPKPVSQPEPVKAKTPPPAVKQPKPVRAQNAPPKPTPTRTPAPKKVLTSSTPTPSRTIVSAPIAGEAQPTSLSSSFSASSSSVSASSNTNGSNPGAPGTVAVGSSAPPRPEPSSSEGISCVSNCEPQYPASLEGAEGSAGVELTLDASGNVVGVELAAANSNSQLNRQALLAARKMKFSSPSSGGASVQVRINFTVAGSEYDRAARQEQRQQERAARERQEREAARQEQLERERQARQAELEREREARARQEQQQQQPITDTPTEPQPMPAPAENEVDAEMLRKFRDRIKNYREE